uniref:Uncharacterized protein n=1 Tax=Arundo donax TaxID=35708 RepID=A0A0A9ATV3_ARUDO
MISCVWMLICGDRIRAISRFSNQDTPIQIS